jgi:potassium/hydrogen antiporter
VVAVDPLAPMFLVDQQLLVLGLLVLLATASSKLSTRVGIPFLVVFVVIGMLAGTDGIGGIVFDDFSLAHAVGTTALILILFDGGLHTSVAALRRALVPAGLLATLGVAITAGVVGLAASVLLDLPPLYGFLLGSVVGSTDAAAVFAALRAGSMKLRPRLASTLEVESGSNDPMAVLLTIAFIEVLVGRMMGVPDVLWFLVKQLVIGGGLGFGIGRLLVLLVNRIDLRAAGLYPMLTLSAALATYGLSGVVGGSGFLAVYVVGVVVGHHRVVFQRGIALFHDGLAWLGQIVMFVVLGLLSLPSAVLDAWAPGLLIGVVLIFVARPLAVALCLFPFGFRWQEVVFASWAGLKGAVPIVLAIYPLMFGLEGADQLFHLVFFVVLTSALVQGWSLPLLARRLGVDIPAPPPPPVTLEITSLRHVDADIVEYAVKEDARAANRSIAQLGLPDGVVITMIARDRDLVPPHDNTVLQPGDYVFVMLTPALRWLADHVFVKEGSSIVRDPIPGDLTLDQLRRRHGVSLPGDANETLDAFLRARLGDRPRSGDRVRLGLLAVTVLDVDTQGRIRDAGIELEGPPPRAATDPGIDPRQTAEDRDVVRRPDT